MEPIEQARRYIAKIPGAVSGSGGHPQTYSVACALVHGFALNDAEAWALLCDYNRTCSPPWQDRELKHKLESAKASTKHEKPRGHLLSTRSVRYKFGAAGVKEKAGSFSYSVSGLNDGSSGSSVSVGSTSIPSKSRAYDISTADELPQPIQDGTRVLLRAMFQPGEGVCICPAVEDESGERDEKPQSAGHVLSVEEWLRRLDERGGDPNRIFSSPREKSAGLNGIYFAINPVKLTGTRANENVTAWRHALIEFDDISKPGQWALIKQSRIPCTAVIDSGGKSLHAQVRVDAKDRAEYDERVAVLYSHFEKQQRPDEKNKDPARLSRLPNCKRGTQRQELLSLKMGAESFSEWMAEQMNDGLGECQRFSELMSLDTSNDPNCVIGFRDGKTLRYLCKGKSAWLLGPSGVGKSSLVSEFAIGWALGRPVFGIMPARKLKSIIVQAENDRYDLAEMVQGVAVAHGLMAGCADLEFVERNVLFKTETTSLREAFIERMHRLVDRERPDLLWVDPLLSFAGIDVSKQDQCSEFLRAWLNPVLEATGVVMIGVHHTGKPKAQKDTKHWTAIDYAYSGLGSSELVNWARAVMVVKPAGEDGQFELKLAKRGARAGATHLDGEWTTTVFCQHSKSGIRWEQIDEPVKPSRHTANKGTDGKSHFDTVAFMAGVGASVMKYGQLIARIEEVANVKERKAKELWKLVKDNFEKGEDDFYRVKQG